MGTTKIILNQPISIKDLNAKLLYVSTAKYEGDWDCTKHSHYFAEIFYITKGCCTFFVDDHVFVVKENDLVIINPNVEHTEESFNSNPLEYVVFGIEGLAFHNLKEDCITQFSVHNSVDNRHRIQFYVTTILIEIEEKRPEYDLICQNLMEVLFVQLLRHANYHLVTTNIMISKKINKECSKIKRYLDMNYSEHITLDKLAEITHMSKYYLIHAFTKDTGLSPINYLNNKRIEQCKNLLETTDYSIAQISSSMGFSSQAYFSQAFKKSFGISPCEYRKAVKAMA